MARIDAFRGVFFVGEKMGNGDMEFDRSVIDGLRSLQRDDEPDLVSGLVDTFFGFVDEKIPLLEAAHQDDGVHQIKETAHALKGAAASVGARGVAKICESLERGEKGAPPAHPQRQELMERLSAALVGTREMLLAEAGSSR